MNNVTTFAIAACAIVIAAAWALTPGLQEGTPAIGLYKQAGDAHPVLDSEYPDQKSCERAADIYMNAVGGPLQQWGCKPIR